MSKHTKEPWIVGTMGHDTDMQTQAGCLLAKTGTDYEWQPIGIADADGFAEVLGLAHEPNANRAVACVNACAGLDLPADLPVGALAKVVKALEALFEHCAMVHKHWGDGSNQKEADAAVIGARLALAALGVKP